MNYGKERGANVKARSFMRKIRRTVMEKYTIKALGKINSKPTYDELQARCIICGKERSTVPLETLNEESFYPMETAASAETEALEEIILDDLVTYLKDLRPDLADVVTLGFQGFTKKDIVKLLKVKSSQAYSTYDKAERLTREFLRK